VRLTLERRTFTNTSTIGHLFIDGEFECFTLEDVVRRGPKVPKATAIPAGEYRVIVNRSPRLKQRLPLLLDVPEFEGVRIHAGNHASDTDGCILVGASVSTDAIGQSRLALRRLVSKIEAAIEAGDTVHIRIANSQAAHG
jgi:hypothetical protein